jgi:hemolysin activation/secretion protein
MAALLALAPLADPASAQAQDDGAIEAGRGPISSVSRLFSREARSGAAGSAESSCSELASELAGRAAAVDASQASRASFVLSDVRVACRGETDFRPRAKSWTPPAGPDLRLEHNEGEALDEHWVRRQFVVNGLIGARVTPDRAAALVQLINIAYVQNGYVNSGVLFARQDFPAQEGVIDLVLVAGAIESAAPDGRPVGVAWHEDRQAGLGPNFIRQRLPSAFEQPFNALDLERDFRLLAENSAIRTINADMGAGAEPGEARLRVIVDPEERFDLYAEVANSRSPSVGGERAALGASLRNALLDGDLVRGEYGVTEGLADGFMTYSSPFIDAYTTFDVRGEYNGAEVVEPALRPLGIESNSTAFELGLTRRLFARPLLPDEQDADQTSPLAPAESWRSKRDISASLKVSRTESETTLLGEPFSFAPGAVDGVTEVTALRAGVDWIERNENRAWTGSAIFSYGLDGTLSDIPDVESPDPHFATALAYLAYAQRFGASWELRTRVTGQLASGPLYTTERFAVGGEATVRGYRENLLLADTAAVGSVEVLRRFSFTPKRRDSHGVDWDSFTLSGFVDGAFAQNESEPALVPETLSSVGAAVAWTPSPAIFASVAYGHALTEVPEAGERDLQDDGVHFRLTVHPLRFYDRFHDE